MILTASKHGRFQFGFGLLAPVLIEFMKKFMQIALLSAWLGGLPDGRMGRGTENRHLQPPQGLRQLLQDHPIHRRPQTGGRRGRKRTQAQMDRKRKKHEDEWRKLIDKANDQAVSADERDKSKKAAADKYAELESDKQSIKEFDQMAARASGKRNFCAATTSSKKSEASSMPTPKPPATPGAGPSG
jgi:hypothetical protein